MIARNKIAEGNSQPERTRGEVTAAVPSAKVASTAPQ